MQAGRLRTILTLLRKSTTQTASGEDVVTWLALGTYRADVVPMAGREMESVGQIWAEARFKITTRLNPSITIKRADRFTWGTRTLDILDAEDVDQHRHQLTIYAKEFTS